MLREVRALLGTGGQPCAAPVVLGGFSQGAMTAVDIALHLPAAEQVKAVAMLSGAPIVVNDWAKRLPAKKGLPVLITHGMSDPVLPFPVSGWSRDLLAQGGAKVQYETHAGGHDLGGAAIIQKLVAFISQAL